MNHAVFCVTPSAAAQIVRRNAVLVVGQHPPGRQPTVETDGAVEHSADLDGELAIALASARQALPVLDRSHVRRSTTLARAGTPLGNRWATK
jgi:hypothetical protein